jgi:branched-chain amino acid transport system substrate-binding protein
MKKKQMIFWTSLLTILVILSVGCTQTPVTGKQVIKLTPIKIGVIAPLTGGGAAYGIASKEGLDLAANEINAQGGMFGKKIELHYQDSQADPKQAVGIMNKFISEGFDIVIVADGSAATMAVAPLAEQTETLMIATLGSTPKLSDMGEYIFRTVPSDAYQGAELARIADAKGFKTAAILYVNDAYGVGIHDVFENAFSGEVVIAESFQDSDTDFRTQLIKIKAKTPDTIILVARYELPTILKQKEELGVDSILLGSETTKNQELIVASGKSAEGLYSVFFAETEDYANYELKFMNEYGHEPTLFGDYSYDGVYVLKEAVERAKSTDATRVRNEMQKTYFRGATGLVEFDSNGEVTNKPFTLYKVVEGEFLAIS